LGWCGGVDVECGVGVGGMSDVEQLAGFIQVARWGHNGEAVDAGRGSDGEGFADAAGADDCVSDHAAGGDIQHERQGVGGAE